MERIVIVAGVILTVLGSLVMEGPDQVFDPAPPVLAAQTAGTGEAICSEAGIVGNSPVAQVLLAEADAQGTADAIAEIWGRRGWETETVSAADVITVTGENQGIVYRAQLKIDGDCCADAEGLCVRVWRSR